RGGGAEHGDRFFFGGGVEEHPVGQRGAHRRRQAQAGGVHGEGVGVNGGDVGGAEGVLVADRADVLHVGHAVHQADHAGGGLGQLGGAAGQRLPVLHREQFGAQCGDLCQQSRL